MFGSAVHLLPPASIMYVTGTVCPPSMEAEPVCCVPPRTQVCVEI
jgi:hypothetical protein